MTARSALLLRLRGARRSRGALAVVVAKNPIRGRDGAPAPDPERRGAVPRAARAVPRGDPAHRLRGRDRRPLPLRHHAPRARARRRRAIGAGCVARVVRRRPLRAAPALGATRPRSRTAGARVRPGRCPTPTSAASTPSAASLFSDALVPFELSSALLMVAVVGARRRRARTPGRARAQPSAMRRQREPAPTSAAARRVQPTSRGRADGDAGGRVMTVEHYVAAQRGALRRSAASASSSGATSSSR